MATNLEFITKQSITTPANNFQITNCFSNKYDVYKIVISKLDTASTTVQRLRFIKSDDSVDTTSNYDYAVNYQRSWSTAIEQRATNGTYIDYISSLTNGTEVGIGLVMYCFNPFDSSSYTFLNFQNSSFMAGSGNRVTKGIGVLTVAQSITGFQMLNSTGNYDTLEVSVYGVK
mgnify:CR=1 FL=1|tara:strand:+ start:548 stop:1066 length:519 start_codon:yes stop_codon:yes gene_type:complete